jgi:hypothetical protein
VKRQSDFEQQSVRFVAFVFAATVFVFAMVRTAMLPRVPTVPWDFSRVHNVVAVIESSRHFMPSGCP